MAKKGKNTEVEEVVEKIELADEAVTTPATETTEEVITETPVKEEVIEPKTEEVKEEIVPVKEEEPTEEPKITVEPQIDTMTFDRPESSEEEKNELVIASSTYGLEDPLDLKDDWTGREDTLQERVQGMQRIFYVNKKFEEVKMKQTLLRNGVYYGWYAVSHPVQKGTSLGLILPNESRMCPCSRMSISLDNVRKLANAGYYLKDLTPGIFPNTITKRNVEQYISKIQLLLTHGQIS